MDSLASSLRSRPVSGSERLKERERERRRKKDGAWRLNTWSSFR